MLLKSKSKITTANAYSAYHVLCVSLSTLYIRTNSILTTILWSRCLEYNPHFTYRWRNWGIERVSRLPNCQYVKEPEFKPGRKSQSPGSLLTTLLFCFSGDSKQWNCSVQTILIKQAEASTIRVTPRVWAAHNILGQKGEVCVEWRMEPKARRRHGKVRASRWGRLAEPTCRARRKLDDFGQGESLDQESEMRQCPAPWVFDKSGNWRVGLGMRELAGLRS